MARRNVRTQESLTDDRSSCEVQEVKVENTASYGIWTAQLGELPAGATKTFVVCRDSLICLPAEVRVRTQEE